MDIKSYLNQTVSYEKCLGIDDEYNVETYDGVKSIKVRIEGCTVYIRDSEHSMILSQKCYWTTEDVYVRDKIDRQYIIQVKPIYDLNGKLIYNECYV